MTTTQTAWNVRTDFATEDLALELDRVEDLRRGFEAKMTQYMIAGSDRWHDESDLAKLAEARGTEIVTELNRRGWFDR